MNANSTVSVYDSSFFDYISIGSRRSAVAVIPRVLEHYSVGSLADIGCGRGAWLAEWENAGILDYTGVDGDYVDVNTLLVKKEHFTKQDLTVRFNIGRKFDLVTSLEVGEHIPPEATDTFVDNLCSHSDAVLFSAATPGQGGTFHVNEQGYDFWRKHFASRGYRLFDFLRPSITSLSQVEPWYRYNTLFFARGAALERLSNKALAMEVKPSEPVPDWSPLTWRVRKAVVGKLPGSWIDSLVEIKHRYVALRNR